jgi:hypothetical protein
VTLPWKKIENKVDIREDYDCALRWASFNGHRETVALLLEHKANVNGKDDCALLWASYHGHKDTVALLMGGGGKSPNPSVTKCFLIKKKFYISNLGMFITKCHRSYT